MKVWGEALALLCVAVVASGARTYCKDSPNAVLTSETGVIEEDKGRYPNNFDCSLVIRPSGKQAGEELVLAFENGDTEKGYDYVYIYAPEDSYEPVASLTGDFSGQEVRTEHASMKVRFVSDRSGRRSGYRASWHTSPSPYVVCSDRPDHVMTARAGRLAEARGNYTNNMRCSVVIRPQKTETETIHLTFDVGETEAEYDFVRVFAPADATSPLRSFTGNFKGATVRTLEPSMRVVFESDPSRTAEGFEASYKIGLGANPTAAPDTRAPTPAPPTPVPVLPCNAPTNCNDNGYCNEYGRCVCFDGWNGTDCSQPRPCPPRVRYSWYSLNRPYKALFLDAVALLKNTTTVYDLFADIHQNRVDNNAAHGSSLFLPWHRLFLWEYETALREFGGRYTCLTLPYWPWEVDARPNQVDQGQAPIFNNTPDGMGPITTTEECVDDPFFRKYFAVVPSSGTCLKRGIRPNYPRNLTFTGQAEVARMIAANDEYQTFHALLERSPHARPHVWTGGSMRRIATSPEDPIFFLHHANVDRIWALWQDCHEYDTISNSNINDTVYWASGNKPDGIDLMMPYNTSTGGHNGRFNHLNVTARDMHSLADVGYMYQDNGLARYLLDNHGCRGTLGWFDLNRPSSSGSGSTHGQKKLATVRSLPWNQAARDFIAHLTREPVLKDLKTAALLECLDLGTGPVPQDWLDENLPGVKSADTASICEGL